MLMSSSNGHWQANASIPSRPSPPHASTDRRLRWGQAAATHAATQSPRWQPSSSRVRIWLPENSSKTACMQVCNERKAWRLAFQLPFHLRHSNIACIVVNPAFEWATDAYLCVRTLAAAGASCGRRESAGREGLGDRERSSGAAGCKQPAAAARWLTGRRSLGGTASQIQRALRRHCQRCDVVGCVKSFRR